MGIFIFICVVIVIVIGYFVYRWVEKEKEEEKIVAEYLNKYKNDDSKVEKQEQEKENTPVEAESAGQFYQKNIYEIKDEDQWSMTSNEDIEEYSPYSQRDHFEGWFYNEVDEYIPVKRRLNITYKDGSNNITKRDISVYKFGYADFGGFILAFCEMRNGNRTFRVDRILECVDLETGKVIPLNGIEKYIMDIWYSSDEYKEIREQKQKQEEKYADERYFISFIEKYKIELKVIIYMVKCDGTFNKREKAIVKEIFESLENSHPRLTDKMLEKIYKNTEMVSFRSFQVNANKLLNNENFKYDLLDISDNIISTQKSIHRNEQDILDYLYKKYENLDLKDKEKLHVYDTKYESIPKETILKESEKECPYCGSFYTLKKGTRKLKNHTNQRYMCNDCGKMFTEKIECT